MAPFLGIPRQITICFRLSEAAMAISDSDDALLLSDEEDSEFLRDLAHRRLGQLKAQSVQSARYYGCIEEITHERQLLDISSVSTGRLIIHFFSPSFARCRTMREHLAKLAKAYPHVRFVEALAQEAPFLVAKWNIRVLPCIVCIVDGCVVDRFFTLPYPLEWSALMSSAARTILKRLSSKRGSSNRVPLHL